jgi:hypothetical protein
MLNVSYREMKALGSGLFSGLQQHLLILTYFHYLKLSSLIPAIRIILM